MITLASRALAAYKQQFGVDAPKYQNVSINYDGDGNPLPSERDALRIYLANPELLPVIGQNMREHNVAVDEGKPMANKVELRGALAKDLKEVDATMRKLALHAQPPKPPLKPEEIFPGITGDPVGARLTRLEKKMDELTKLIRDIFGG